MSAAASGTSRGPGPGLAPGYVSAGAVVAPAASHRLFFALWPSEPERQALATAVRGSVAAGHGRAVPARNFHLTLAFLGSVPAARLGEVRAVGAAVAQRRRQRGGPFVHVTLDGIEWWKRPRVLVATATGPVPTAEALAHDLQASLAAAGFRPDLKPFRPHVTLARKISCTTTGPIAPPVPLSFGGFALVDSVTEPGGSVYSVIDSWALCDG